MLKDFPSLAKVMVAVVISISFDPHSHGHWFSRI